MGFSCADHQSLFFASFPSLEFDSWFTIGSADSNGTSDVQQVGMDDYFDAFEAGGGFTIDTFIGGSWFCFQDRALTRSLVPMAGF